MKDGRESTPRNGFAARSLSWARGQGVLTRVRPEWVEVDARGRGGAHGHRALRGRWATVTYAGFLTVIGAVLVAGAGERAELGAGRRRAMDIGAIGLTVAAGVELVVGETLRRRERRKVHLVWDERTRVRSATDLDELGRCGGALPANGETWLFAAQGFGPRARELAATRGIRCFVPNGREFAELAREPSTPPEPGPRPPTS